MQVSFSILSLLLDVRAQIPNQPGFRDSNSYFVQQATVRAVAAFLSIVAFLATLVGLAVRLVIGFS